MDNVKTLERIARLEQNDKSAQHRLSELEEEVKENRELTIAVKEIATEMKYLREEQSSMRDEQANMNDRLKVIEEKPAKNWDNLIKIIITRICYSNSGLFFSKIRIIKE